MSQDELAIKIIIDDSQFKDELTRLRRDLEDEYRIEIDKLKVDRKDDYRDQPTVVEVRETITGVDDTTANKINDVIEDVRELKVGLGLPAEFMRLTPDKLQDLVREAFKHGGFKDILERDPAAAEDIGCGSSYRRDNGRNGTF